MGKYTKAVLNSPPEPHTHIVEKEQIHRQRENAKTLYGFFNAGDGETSTDPLEILRAIVTRVKREHIDSFYRTAYEKFVIFLKKTDFKHHYNHELNFRKKILGVDHLFRILPDPPRREKNRPRKYDENTVFIAIFLPATVSDTAVERAFMGFDEVHVVFAGTYRSDFKEIWNVKRHVRLTTIHVSKTDFPHEIQFQGSDRVFNVMWAKKEVLCKNCKTVHTLKIRKCEGQESTSKKDKDGVDENLAAGQKSIDFDSAATLSQLQTHPSEMDKQNQNVLVESLGPNYPKVVEGSLKLEDSLKIPGNEINLEFDSEVCQTRLSDQESGNMNKAHDSWADVHPDRHASDQTSVPNEFQNIITMNADSRNANEKQFFTVSADNAETDEDCFEGLETTNPQQIQSFYQILQSDVNSSATAIVVANQPPSERVDKDPT